MLKARAFSRAITPKASGNFRGSATTPRRQVASIAFGVPHAVVDGNVRRVIARLAGDAGVDVQEIADRLLDRKNPARSNQALMELGALVCLPREPLCGACPVARLCVARRDGTQAELPAKRPRAEVEADQGGASGDSNAGQDSTDAERAGARILGSAGAVRRSSGQRPLRHFSAYHHEYSICLRS